MDFDIDRRELLKAAGAGMATVTVTTGVAGAQTDLADLPGDGSEANPYQLDSFEDLLAIDQDLTANYVLTDNIEFGGEGAILPLAFDNSGYSSVDFTGTLDGQGFEVRDFVVDGSSGYDGGGLLGSIGDGGVVKNLDIVNIDVIGDTFAGGLTGEFDGGTDGEINNVTVTGAVESRGLFGAFPPTAGGLVGVMNSGTITDSGSSADVRGGENLGGVVGFMLGGDITRTYAEGSVEPAAEEFTTEAGGFVGDMRTGSITLSFATGGVVGSSEIGGFVGDMEGGNITKAYARGDATGIEGVEGSPPDNIGGFAGLISSGTVEEVYSTGAVSTTVEGSGLGGLVGLFDSAELVEEESISVLSFHVTDGYWDVPASGQETSDGGTGLGNIEDTPPANEMTGDDAPNNMAGFDFQNTWVTVTGDENAIIGFKPAGTQIQATQPTGPGYPVFGWQLVEEEKECIDRRNLSRGQEEKECPFDQSIERGGSRQGLDRSSGRGGDDTHRDSETARRDRSRGR